MKVTIEQVLARIVETEFQLTHDTLTLCFITLDNGFVITGESRPIDPAEYNAGWGRDAAKKNAIEQVWPYLGFLAMEDAHRIACQPRLELTEDEREQRLAEFYGR